MHSIARTRSLLLALSLAPAFALLSAEARVEASQPSAAPRADLEELEEARAAARERLVTRLEELAEWCSKKKLYAARVGVYESLLHFEPEHVGALRGLGYKKGSDGEWHPPENGREPEDWNKSALREFPEKRAAVTVDYRDEMLALLEEHADHEEFGRAQREAIYQDLLFANPDDSFVRELMGEVQLEGRWVLAETARAKQHRGELRQMVREAFAEAPKPERGEATEREAAFDIEWSAIWVTPEVRSLGTGSTEEVARMTTAMHATREYFNGALGAEATYPEPLTIFTLARPSDKVAFLRAHPAVDDGYRKFLLQLDGSGIQGSGDFAHWAPEERRRLDGLVRQAIAWLFAGGFGIGTEHGWLFEGFGLYLTRELVGTRLTWFVRESKYLTPEEDQALKARLMDSRTNWMNEAHEFFRERGSIKLQFLLGKDVNQLNTEDILYSYVLAAYLLEAEAEVLPELLRKIGAGATSVEALREVFEIDLARLDERVRRWLSERR